MIRVDVYERTVGELVEEYIDEEGFCLDFMKGAVRLPEGVGNIPVVELDQTDHIVFRCSGCGSKLVLAEICVYGRSRDVYGTVTLRFFCPQCGKTYYKKFYSVGPLKNVDYR